MMIAMPTALAQKTRSWWHYVMLGMMFVATMIVGSRGGQVFIGIEVIVCCFWAWRAESDVIKRLWNRTYFFWALMVIGYVLALLIINAISIGLISKTESRSLLLDRSFQNFVDNPLFGTGLGYRGNADLYSGKQGTINWYHMMIPQIVGGFGLCGIAAWRYQFYVRSKLSLSAWPKRDFGFALCYFGLFLMSQVNPGEFCPVPYAFLSVCAFAALENSIGESKEKVLQASA